jgi:hypothetical protein
MSARCGPDAVGDTCEIGRSARHRREPMAPFDRDLGSAKPALGKQRCGQPVLPGVADPEAMLPMLSTRLADCVAAVVPGRTSAHQSDATGPHRDRGILALSSGVQLNPAGPFSGLSDAAKGIGNGKHNELGERDSLDQQ